MLRRLLQGFPFEEMYKIRNERSRKKYISEVTLAEAMRRVLDDPCLMTFSTLLYVVQKKPWTKEEAHTVAVHLNHFLYTGTEEDRMMALNILIEMGQPALWVIVNESAWHPSEEIRNRCLEALRKE
jgi:hypothetical protein